MRPAYVLEPEALRNIRDIVEYIEKSSPQGAWTVLHAIREALDRLGEFPHIGHKRADLTDRPLRFYNVFRYQIIYDPDAEPIRIYRIVHGAQDVKSLLAQAHDLP